MVNWTPSTLIGTVITLIANELHRNPPTNETSKPTSRRPRLNTPSVPPKIHSFASSLSVEECDNLINNPDVLKAMLINISPEASQLLKRLSETCLSTRAQLIKNSEVEQKLSSQETEVVELREKCLTLAKQLTQIIIEKQQLGGVRSIANQKELIVFLEDVQKIAEAKSDSLMVELQQGSSRDGEKSWNWLEWKGRYQQAREEVHKLNAILQSIKLHPSV